MTKHPRILPDPGTEPPEELRALCALCDIGYIYVHGRPARTWRLSVRKGGINNNITLQSTQFEDWNDAVKKLVAWRYGYEVLL